MSLTEDAIHVKSSGTRCQCSFFLNQIWLKVHLKIKLITFEKAETHQSLFLVKQRTSFIILAIGAPG
jgi:hypothetical protein